MRVLCTIAGCVRFGRVELRDVDVRKLLGVGSVGSQARQRRLKYMMRLISRRPPSLWALLGIFADKHGQRRLPWVDMMLDDLSNLRLHRLDKLNELPNPRDDFNVWACLMSHFPNEFSQLVDSVVTFESPSDTCKAEKSRTIGTHFCSLCDCKPFLSSRALQAHQRVVQRVRNQPKQFLDDSCVCPVCKAFFSTRLRLISHISEKRKRGKAQITCNQVLLSGAFKPLPQKKLDELDAKDREARKQARRSGRTQPIALFPAKRSRVRASPDESTCKRRRGLV